jgi:uncharacterized protein YqhQ
MKSSGIGGQAVIEGVMMKNRGQYAIAVRKPNGEIEVDVKSCTDVTKRKLFFRLPIIRGIMAFIDSLTIGMGTLQYSASFYDEDEKESEFEKRLDKLTRGHGEKFMDVATVLFSVILALVIFVLVPMLITSFVSPYLQFEHSRIVVSLIEGVLRVVIFILYIVLISQMEDIKRMFMYHGAEHKCINCIEHGRTLTVDNVRRSSKEHKRCGTSFMLNVMLLSILLFMVIDVDNVWLKLGLRLVLIPVIAGVSYEFTRLAGSTDNKIVNFLSKPGLLMQALTTKEPDDSMIEVGIASVEAVFDWEPFVEELKNERRAVRSSVNEKADSGTKEKKHTGNKKNAEEVRKEETGVKAKEPVEEKVIAPISEEAFKPLEVDISDLFDIKLPEADEHTKKNSRKNSKKGAQETKTIQKKEPDEKEADELLAALDVMFEYNGAKTVTEMSDDPAVTSGENIVFEFDSEAVQQEQDAIDLKAGEKQELI